MLSILLLISALTAFWLFIVIHNHYNYWRFRNVPYEQPDFFYGNLRGFGTTKSLAAILQKFYEKFKSDYKVCGFFYFLRPALIILDLDLAKDILLNDFLYFPNKDRYSNDKVDPLSATVMNLRDKEWSFHKHRFSMQMTPLKVKRFKEKTLREGYRLIQFLNEQDSKVDFRDVFLRYLINVVGSITLEMDCDAFIDTTYFKRFLSITQPLTYPSGILKICMSSFPRAFSKFNYRLRPWDSDVLIDIVQGILRDESFPKSEVIKNSLECGMTVKKMSAQLFSYYEGAFITISALLTCCLFELACHEMIQDRLRSCIKDTDAHPYLDQIVNETLRLHSNAAQISRLCEKDYYSKYHKVRIEKGVLVIIPIYGIHLDPNLYPNPSIFDPDRFSPEKINERHKLSFISFGLGKRGCPGELLGRMIINTSIALLLRNFKFTTVDETNTPISMGFGQTMKPSEPVLLGVERILW